MKQLKRILLLLLVTLATVLCACADGKAADSSSQITVGIPQDLDSLDPYKAVAAGTKEVIFNIFEGLMRLDSDGNVYAAVASDVAVSEDGLTYTFTLRDGIKFHDGSPVTVADVKYSIEHLAGMDGESPIIAAFSIVESVETPDDRTILIKLNSANNDFLTELASVTAAIVPKDYKNQETAPIGTGPYKFVSRSVQEKIVVTAFDEYWGDPAGIKDVTFKICSNPDTIVMELLGGSIDMYARISEAQAAQLNDSFDVLEGSMNLVQAMYLNNDFEPFKDERVRKALCYAVDRQAVLDFMADGKGTIIGSSMFPAFGKYYMPELSDYYERDLDKARALLKEAGYEDGFSFTITVSSNYQPHVDTATILTQQLKEVGVDAQIKLVEWDTWLSEVYSDRNFEATVVGLDASTLTARALLERYASDGKKNFINFKNADYDIALKKAIEAVDSDEQVKNYKDCERILCEHAANVYIQDLSELVAINKKFGGYEFYPLYIQDISKLYLK